MRARTPAIAADLPKSELAASKSWFKGELSTDVRGIQTRQETRNQDKLSWTRVYHVAERPQSPIARRTPHYAHQDRRRRTFTPKSTKGAGRAEIALAALLERLARDAVRNLFWGH